MKTNASVRLPASLHESLQREAAMRRLPLTVIVLEALAPYLEGDAHLEKQEPNDKRTSFRLYTKDLNKLKALAAEANMPWDAALRQILTKRKQ